MHLVLEDPSLSWPAQVLYRHSKWGEKHVLLSYQRVVWREGKGHLSPSCKLTRHRSEQEGDPGPHPDHQEGLALQLQGHHVSLPLSVNFSNLGFKSSLSARQNGHVGRDTYKISFPQGIMSLIIFSVSPDRLNKICLVSKLHCVLRHLIIQP